MKNLKILTFNWHEGYIHLLAKTGYEFDIVERWKGGTYGWVREFRPVPPNCSLISEDKAKAKLDAGNYDRIIAHNLQDFAIISEYPMPKILLHHNKLPIETNIFDKTKQEELLKKLHVMYRETKNLTLVFVSKAKKDSWGLDGEVILLSADPDDYEGYTGHVEKALRVGNYIMERDGLLGYSVQERLLVNLPSTVLGLNPKIHGAILPRDWAEFKDFLKSHRIYLNTTTQLDDGYNCSMLEAMATGMPVVSTANPSSPVEDGINGYVSSNEDYLRSRIEELLRNHSLAKSLGKKARETVMDKFPLEGFINGWKRVLNAPSYKVKNHEKDTASEKASEDKKLKILMSYTSNPQTTAAYLEKALRKHHDVKTYGSSISYEIIKMWDLEKIKDRVENHDIPYYTPDIYTVFNNLAGNWAPDVFLWVESGVWDSMEGFDKLPCLTACYLIDTHLGLERRVAWARNFDVVFIAQKADVEKFKERGIENVFWIPLACDPEIHKKKIDKKLFDIGFVGSLNNPKRIALMNGLAQRFNVYYERCFLERMAEVFSQAKIVFNNAVQDDLNMRVFEALCSGSLLLTDEAKGSGLTEMFQHRKHLVIYKNEKELFELADYYLRNEDEAEKIAAEGMKEVLSKHTYEHRANEMIRIIRSLKDAAAASGRQKNLSVSIDGQRDYFRQERKDVEAIIPDSARKILDLGSGAGLLGKRLLQRGAEEVVGIEIDYQACEEARQNLSQVISGDIEDIDLPFEEKSFDCIIFADVLEHLKDPLSVLKRLKKYLADTGVVIASIPNVRYFCVINMLVNGRWEYEDSGILDRTHLRFFTKKEMEMLFSEAGFEITGISESSLHPKYYELNGSAQGNISFGRVSLSGLNDTEMRDLFVGQYLIRARKVGTELKKLDDLVSAAISSGNTKEAERIFAEHLEMHPADMEALYRHAEVCHRLGLHDRAAESLERILLFEPERQDALKLKNLITEIRGSKSVF